MGAEAYADRIHKDLNKECLALWDMKVVWTLLSNWERISAAIQLFNTVRICFSARMIAGGGGKGKEDKLLFFLPLPVVLPIVI